MAVPLVISGLPWALASLLTGLGTISFRKHSKRPPNNLDVAFSLLPVSILKPLKGADAGLRENLESFFRIDYPEFELLFSVADADDPAIAVVQGLRARYPEVAARLWIGRRAMEVGPNPKVNNLLDPYESAQHDWMLISDSNVRVEPDALRRLVAHIRSDTGIVTSIVSGQGARGLGGKLEAVFLNTFYARGMIVARDLGRPCVIGKSMLFRRSVAARFGGLAVLGRYLAEDFMAGEAMRKLGLQVVIAHEPVAQYIGRHSVSQFWSRHLRWGRIRKAQAPLAFAIEPLLGCASSGVIGAWALAQSFGMSGVGFLAVHGCAWFFCDLLVASRLDPELGVQALPGWAAAWVLREALALPLWAHIASGNRVNWRGRRLKLEAGGLLQCE